MSSKWIHAKVIVGSSMIAIAAVTGLFVAGERSAHAESEAVQVPPSTVASATYDSTGRSGNSDLSGLVLSGVTLTSVFDPAVVAYTGAVPSRVAYLTVTGEVYDPGATITVNGVQAASGQRSSWISLAPVSNTITIQVTALDGTQKTYTVTVLRAPKPVSRTPETAAVEDKPKAVKP